jgi:hypothetical protein
VTRNGAQKAKIQTRGMIKESEARKPNAALAEAKRQAKLKLTNNNKAMTTEVKDIFSSVSCTDI